MKCQQFELYAAERSMTSGREFGSVSAMQRFIDDLRDTWWWQLWYPMVRRVEVYSRPSSRNESVGSWHPELAAGKLEMLRVHWNELALLHELAHTLAAARYGSRSHDPWFARVYLELTSLVVGPELYAALYEAFQAHDIEHVIPEERRLGEARRV